MFSYKRSFLFVVTVLVVVTLCENCDSFTNITISITSKNSSGYLLFNEMPQFLGCITSDVSSQSIIEVAVLDQTVHSIGYKSIKNMPDLEKISFLGSEVEEISPNSFDNVPRLRIIRITNGNLKKVVAGIFNMTTEVEVVDLEENDITEIAPYAFGYLSSLKQIILSKNNLQTWDHLWLINSSNIEVIDISHNQIGRIPYLVLLETPRLMELRLDFNEIESIDAQAFKNLNNMKYLGLSHNRIIELKVNIFPKKLIVNEMKINANFFNFLSEGVLDRLSVKEITLEGNPWECKCLDVIYNWLYNLNSSLKTTEYCRGSNIPQCSFSNSKAQHCSENINEDLTNAYINKLKSLYPPLNKLCARFD